VCKLRLALRLLFSGFFLCTCALAPQNALTQTDVPFSFPSNYISDILDVHIDDAGTGFLGGTCGVLRKTTDNGQSWTVIDAPSEADLETIACPPGGCATALLATDGALYRLSGGNWTDVTYPNYEEGGTLHWLTANLVVHEAGASGLWRSTNGGTSWTRVDYGVNKSSNLIMVDATTGYLFANGQLLTTADGAASFTEVGYTHPNNLFHHAWLDASTGWTFDRDRRFWKTTDGGQTWARLNDEQQLSSMTFFLALTADHLVAAQVTWTRSQYGVDHYKGGARKYHRSGTSFFLPGAQNQLLYSPADFADWVDLEGKALQSGIIDIAIATDETGYAIGGVDLYVTTDAGATWSVERIGSVMRALGVLPSGDPVIMTDSETQVSRDQGQTFTDLFAAGMVPETLDNPDLMTIKPDGSVYFFGPNSSYISMDGGTSFTRTEHGSGLFAKAIFFVDEDHGYVVDRNRKFSYTSDGGMTWQVRTDVPPFSPEALFFTSRDEGWISSANRRYETTDGGMNWTDATDRAGGYDFTRRAADGAIYAASGDENTLVRSMDDGVSWTALAGHCFGYRALALTPNERYAFVAGDGFIVRHDLEELVTSTRRRNLPEALSLRAYPNPSNAQFWLEVPMTASATSLSVFDMSVRKDSSPGLAGRSGAFGQRFCPRDRKPEPAADRGFHAGDDVDRKAFGSRVFGMAGMIWRARGMQSKALKQTP